MTTETSPLNRQPSKLDYSSPTQFRFLINQLPKVQYFTVAANIPGLSLNETSYATPLKDIPLIGEKIEYEDLTITFNNTGGSATFTDTSLQINAKIEER